MTPSTVYDRQQLTGFMTGPKHNLAGMSGEGRLMPQVDGEGGAAPNYRESDTSGEECMSCQNIDMDSGQCSKYGFKPKLYFVCDSFAGEGETETPLEEGSELPTS